MQKKYIKNGLVVILIFLSVNFINAQNSFYSSYGLGQKYMESTTRMAGLGFSGSAVYDSLNITSYNPALWHSFYTVSLQGELNYSSMSAGNTDGQFQSADLTGFTVKLPLGNYSGLAFGVKPLYRTNSETKVTESIDFDNETLGYENDFLTKGGVSEFYIGGGYRVTKYLSAGLVAKFLFGKYSSRLRTEASTNNYYLNSNKSVKGHQLGGGLHWRVPHNYSVALYYDHNLDFQYDSKVAYQFGPGDTTGYKDINFPSRLQLGLAKNIKPNLVLSSDIVLSQMPQSFSDFSIYGQGEYQDAYQIGIGLEQRPSGDYNATFLESMYYRVGGYYRQGDYAIDSDPPTEMGISAGFGLPFYNRFSRLDVAVIYSITDGYLASDIGKENKITIDLEITSGGLWFFNALQK